MPESIVIAGGGRNVGKTHLARAIGEILPRCAVVKLGVHHARAEKGGLFFERGTAYGEILARVEPCDFVVIESGAILDDPDIDPALVIYLPASHEDKAGARQRLERAHLVRGRESSEDQLRSIAKRLGVSEKSVAEIVSRMEEFEPPAAP